MESKDFVIGVITIALSLISSVIGATVYTHDNFIGIREIDRIYKQLDEIKISIDQIRYEQKKTATRESR